MVFTALFEAGGQEVNRNVVQSRGRVLLHDGVAVAAVGRQRGRPRRPSLRPAEVGGGGRELPRRFGESTVVGGDGPDLGGGVGGGVAG